MAPTVLTVLLNYRTAEMTLRSAGVALKAMEGIDGEIIIVDNDSRDGSFEAMTKAVVANGWSDRIRVMDSGHNGGFGAGNNVGIRAGLRSGEAPDYVYVLNSDAFPAPDAIRLLLDHLETHPKAAFAGSYLHGPEGDAHRSCFRFPSILSEFEGAARIGPISRLLAGQSLSIPVPEATGPVDWLAGASLMMRQSVLDEVGLFDETYFLYFEETDLSLRVARAGHEVHFVRESEVEHIGSVSTGMRSWNKVPGYWFDSRLYYFRKNHGAVYAHLATLSHLAGGALHRLRQALRGKTPVDPPGFLATLARHHFSSGRTDRKIPPGPGSRLNGVS
jgi:GT2 family glycosyltransferase